MTPARSMEIHYVLFLSLVMEININIYINTSFSNLMIWSTFKVIEENIVLLIYIMKRMIMHNSFIIFIQFRPVESNFDP